MKVAIIGAGLAGLSCAIVLEKHGIIPVVFEKTGFIGDREQHVGASLHIINRPIRDILKYTKRNFGIDIKPLNTINKMTHLSEHQRITLTGNFGYFTRRDKGEDSVKGQLYSQLTKTDVIFRTDADYKKLSSQYDYVVIADGKPDIAEEIGCWTDWANGIIKGAVIEGNFDCNELIMWLNKVYCRNGYAYLTPFSSQKASLALYVPDVSLKEIDTYWDSFIKTENITSNIVETFKVKHGSGYVYPHKVDNLLLAGNTGGAIDPMRGFGQMKSIVMGGLAAKSIIENKDYEKLISMFIKINTRLYEFRKAFDKLENQDYDAMLKLLRIIGVKPVVYDFPTNPIKYGYLAIKVIKKLKGNGY